MTVFLVDQDDHKEWKMTLKENESVADILEKLPEDYRKRQIIYNDRTWPPNALIPEVLEPMSVIYFESQGNKDDDSNTIKLTFMLPNGEKKKLKLNLDMTFMDVLKNLEFPKAKLYFDGDEVQLNKRIADNKDIQDCDQLDVKLQK